MFPAPSRRDVLRTLLAAAAAGLPVTARAQPRPASPLVSTPLTDSLLLVTGAGGNVVVAHGPGGVLMVNGGTADRSREVLALVAERTGGARVETLVNTDWHPDHGGCNETLGRAGTRILAHEHTKQYMAADVVVEWQDRTYPARPAPALPTETFYTSGELTAGGEPARYGHLGQAHTDGDAYVFFPQSNVLVAGDVLAVGAYPIADYTTGGWLGGLATATRTLLDLTNAGTRIVPGSGPLQTRADLQAQHEMLVAMRDRLGKMMRQGMGAEDMLAAGATKDFDARWGSPATFVATSYRGLWLHVRELGGVV